MPRPRPRPNRLPPNVIDELKDRLYRYTLKFQRIADRLRESRIPEDEFTRINAIAQGEWGPGRLYRIPKADNEEERRAFFQMIEDRYALVDSTTDYLELHRSQLAFYYAILVVQEQELAEEDYIRIYREACDKAMLELTGRDRRVPRQANMASEIYNIVLKKFKYKLGEEPERVVKVNDYLNSALYGPIYMVEIDGNPEERKDIEEMREILASRTSDYIDE